MCDTDEASLAEDFKGISVDNIFEGCAWCCLWGQIHLDHNSSSFLDQRLLDHSFPWELQEAYRIWKRESKSWFWDGRLAEQVSRCWVLEYLSWSPSPFQIMYSLWVAGEDGSHSCVPVTCMGDWQWTPSCWPQLRPAQLLWVMFAFQIKKQFIKCT